MKTKLALLASAVAVLAACAAGPSMEGGIVGTGSRPDCEALKKQGGKAPLPEECR
jgi:hypothetical protein